GYFPFQSGHVSCCGQLSQRPLELQGIFADLVLCDLYLLLRDQGTGISLLRLGFLHRIEDGEPDIQATAEIVGSVVAIVQIVVVIFGKVSVLGSPVARACAAATFCWACFTARLFSTARAGRSSSCEIAGRSGIDAGSTAIDSAGNPSSLDRCSRSTSACPCASAVRNRMRAATN